MNLSFYPQRITVCITGACQLNCRYCSRPTLMKNHPEHKDRKISFDKFTEIIEGISPYFSGDLAYGGVGEPTLHPEFFGMAEFAQKHLKKARIILFTNGNNLNKTLQHRKFFNQIFLTLHPLSSDKLTTLKIEKDTVQTQKYPYHNFGVNKPNFTRNRYPCSQLFHHLYITTIGTAYPCCMGTTAEVLDDTSLSLGQFTYTTDFFHNKKHRKIIEKQLNGVYDGFCANCDLYKNYPNFWVKFRGKWR